MKLGLVPVADDLAVPDCCTTVDVFHSIPVEERLMYKRMTGWLLFLPLADVIAADNGDVTDVTESDRLGPDSSYKLIGERQLAKWTDKHLVCCHGLQLQGKTDMGDIVCSYC